MKHFLPELQIPFGNKNAIRWSKSGTLVTYVAFCGGCTVFVKVPRQPVIKATSLVSQGEIAAFIKAALS